MENEELLTPRSGWVDLVAPHLPDGVLNVLEEIELIVGRRREPDLKCQH